MHGKPSELVASKCLFSSPGRQSAAPSWPVVLVQWLRNVWNLCMQQRLGPPNAAVEIVGWNTVQASSASRASETTRMGRKRRWLAAIKVRSLPHDPGLTIGSRYDWNASRKCDCNQLAISIFAGVSLRSRPYSRSLSPTNRMLAPFCYNLETSKDGQAGEEDCSAAPATSPQSRLSS